MLEIERDEQGVYWQRIGPDTWQRLGGGPITPRCDAPSNDGPTYAEMLQVMSFLLPAPTIARNPDGSITHTFGQE